jgi:hypothetical protein
MISTITNSIRAIVDYMFAPSNIAVKLAMGSNEGQPSSALKVILSRIVLLSLILLLVFVDIDPTTKDIITDVIRSELNTHTGDVINSDSTPVLDDDYE